MKPLKTALFRTTKKKSTSPVKSVGAFQCSFQFRAMQPSCPKGTNSPPPLPSPPLVQCCFGLTAEVCISSVTVNNIAIGEGGNGLLICDYEHFCQSKCKKIGIFVMCLNRFCARFVCFDSVLVSSRGFLRYTCKRYIAFPKQSTWILRSFDFNSVLTGQTSEKVAFKSSFDNLLEYFLRRAFARIISVLPEKFPKISVTGGAAAPLEPPARTPMILNDIFREKGGKQ